MACKVVALLQQRGLTIAVAESCTGGAIAAAVTLVPGCSSVMLGGVVAYNNSVKADVLGVSNEDLIFLCKMFITYSCIVLFFQQEIFFIFISKANIVA